MKNLIVIFLLFFSSSAFAVCPASTNECLVNKEIIPEFITNGDVSSKAPRGDDSCRIYLSSNNRLGTNGVFDVGYSYQYIEPICHGLRLSDNYLIGSYPVVGSTLGFCPTDSSQDVTNTTVCSCNSGFIANAATSCVPVVPVTCTAGEVQSTGYYDLGTVLSTAQASLSSCSAGCSATFQGNPAPDWKYTSGGSIHYLAFGSYITDGFACTVGQNSASSQIPISSSSAASVASAASSSVGAASSVSVASDVPVASGVPAASGVGGVVSTTDSGLAAALNAISVALEAISTSIVSLKDEIIATDKNPNLPSGAGDNIAALDIARQKELTDFSFHFDGLSLPSLPTFNFPTFTPVACISPTITYQGEVITWNICSIVPTIKTIAAWVLNVICAAVCFQMLMNFRAMRVRG